MTKYRADIDGLRAVAVLPVVLFHAGFEAFSGGFVGVDVFFVISGYLITIILITELEVNDFSFRRFYERRARRILPALFFVMALTLPAAWLWMLPGQLDGYFQSIIYVVLFSSNVLFWQEHGYFTGAAELKPLLHTWSLAVEEQFYVLFPILLLLLWKLGRRTAALIIIVLALISLGLSEWAWRNTPVANFYLAPTRAWELLAGSLCAFAMVGKAPRSSDVLSALGLALIALSILFYDATTPFPSLYAVPPVLGASLIILFGAQQGWTTRLLTSRPLVGIGLISYSTYLWHQPLFAFARIRTVREPTPELMFALAALSLVLGWATWRWVERPFRIGPHGKFPKPVSILAMSVIASVALVSVGWLGGTKDGAEGRFDPVVLEVLDTANDRAEWTCLYTPFTPLPQGVVDDCITPNGAGDVHAMLIGDSHSLSISSEVGSALSARDIGYYNLSYPGCPPLTGLGTRDLNHTHDCDGFMQTALTHAATLGVEAVVMTARFPFYVLGKRYDNHEGGVETGAQECWDLLGHLTCDLADPSRQARVLDAVERSVLGFAEDFDVILVHPTPDAGWNVPEHVAKMILYEGGRQPVTTSYDRYLERIVEITALFSNLAETHDRVFDAKIHEDLCDARTRRCINADVGGIYYFDDDHLTNAGARLVSASIAQVVEAALLSDLR